MAEEVRPEQEEGLPATIWLEVLPDRAEQVQTRVAEKDESAIKDLHVLVYNSAGELIGQSYAVYNASKPAFTVKTRSGSNNTIYVIANTSNANLFDGTVAATETKLKAMKTPAAEPNGGNAMVAIKNYKKEILWSWHIWVTSYDGSTTFTNNNGKRDFTFMDRALGATIATAGLLNSCGLLYQWGRKDPFPSILLS